MNHLYYYWENDVRKHDSISQLYKYEKENQSYCILKTQLSRIGSQKFYSGNRFFFFKKKKKKKTYTNKIYN